MMLFDRGIGSPAELMAGYRFVHSPHPQSPPQSRGLRLYCQPYLLSDERGADAPSELAQHLFQRAELQARNAPQVESVRRTFRGYIGAEPAKAWPLSPSGTRRKSISAVTAATERLAEQMQVQYQQVLRDQVIPESIANNDMNVAMNTIALLRKAVGKIEDRRLYGDIATRVQDMERERTQIVEPQSDISEKSTPDARGASEPPVGHSEKRLRDGEGEAVEP